MPIESTNSQDVEGNLIPTGNASINGNTGIFTKEEILARISYLKSIHKGVSSGDIFRQIANGLFQAEGSVTGKFIEKSTIFHLQFLWAVGP